jgi:hypothetical protein
VNRGEQDRTSEQQGELSEKMGARKVLCERQREGNEHLDFRKQGTSYLKKRE